MNEEKDLQEEEIAADEGMEDLDSFVDIADLDELEYTDNQDVFGELGDIADLGEIPDLSPDTLSDTDIPEMVEEISDTDLEEESEKTKFHTVEPEEELADLMEEDVPMPEEEDISVPETDDMSDTESDIPKPEEDESSDTESDIPEPEQDGVSDTESDIPMPEEDDISDAESDMLILEQDTEEEEAIGMPDIGFDDGADEPILDDAVSDILAEEEGMADMDLGFSDEEEAVPAAEEGSESGMDSMLGGLLDNLDMGGSLSDDAPLGVDDALVPMDGLDELSADTDDIMDIAEMMPEQEQQPEKEPGLLKRVFGNVVTDEIAEQERLAAQKEEEEAEKKKEEAAKAKEEAEAKKEEKAAEKAAKKEEKKKLKEAKKAEKAAAKEEKKKKKEEEKAAEAAELEVIGKLNKVGVSIIAIATVLFLTVEIAGTNVFGYRSTKNKAMDYFDMGKYTQAYKEAVGTKMAQKDEEEYNKIKVVMKVQQSLNAYRNYDRVSYYPEALDALLRGLKRYDANIDEGIELEVDSDMMSCRKQILTLLQSEFNLSESDAYSILGLDSEKYQEKVVELGLKKR